MFARLDGYRLEPDTRTARQSISLRLHAQKVRLVQTDHHTANTAVTHQQVGPPPKHA